VLSIARPSRTSSHFSKFFTFICLITHSQPSYAAFVGGRLAAMRVEFERIRVRRHEEVEQK
jgi:hypothetical protein